MYEKPESARDVVPRQISLVDDYFQSQLLKMLDGVISRRSRRETERGQRLDGSIVGGIFGKALVNTFQKSPVQRGKLVAEIFEKWRSEFVLREGLMKQSGNNKNLGYE